MGDRVFALRLGGLSSRDEGCVHDFRVIGEGQLVWGRHVQRNEDEAREGDSERGQGGEEKLAHCEWIGEEVDCVQVVGVCQ